MVTVPYPGASPDEVERDLVASTLLVDFPHALAEPGRVLGELALSSWGIGKQEWLQRASDASFEHHAKLAGVRKYDDHSNRHGHGGFFFWYDMRARSEAIMQLEDPEARAKAIAAQRELILSLPEIDGCFVDSHELGRAYGTAMALLSLRVMQ